MERQKKKYYIWLAADALWIFVILGHSLMPGGVSGQESGFVLQLVRHVLPFMTHHLLRKMAHFTEYAILGGMLSATMDRDKSLLRPAVLQRTSEEARRLWLPALFALLVAAVDEGIIQRITPGRSGELRDMLIDLGGALFGAALVCLFRRKEAKSGQD